MEIANEEDEREDTKEPQDFSYSNKGFEFLNTISDPQEKVRKSAKKKEVEEPNGWDFDIDIDSKMSDTKSPEAKTEEKPVLKKAKGPAKISSLPKKGETKQTKTEDAKIKALKNPFGKGKKTEGIMSIDDFFNET